VYAAKFIEVLAACLNHRIVRLEGRERDREGAFVELLGGRQVVRFFANDREIVVGARQIGVLRTETRLLQGRRLP
jgi:hypothetical protein